MIPLIVCLRIPPETDQRSGPYYILACDAYPETFMRLSLSTLLGEGVKNHPPQKKDSDNDQDATKERRKRVTVDTSHRVYKQVQRTNRLSEEP